jgi:hypothetical protein
MKTLSKCLTMWATAQIKVGKGWRTEAHTSTNKYFIYIRSAIESSPHHKRMADSVEFILTSLP